MGERIKERAAVIIVNDGRILLMHRKRADRDYYVVPGGGVEPGETANDAAVREAKEETGLTVKLGERLCTCDNDGRLEHYFLAASYRGELGITGPERERRSPDNLYDLEWVEAVRLQTMNLQPVGIRRVLAGCLLTDPSR